MQIDKPIFIAIILFIVLLSAFFFVVPQYKNLKSLQIDLGQKNAEYIAKFDYYAQIKKNYDDIQKRKADIQKIDDALPKNPNFGQLIYYFQKKAGESGLVLKTISLSQSSSAGGINNLTFSLGISGDYVSLENFMISLEKSARLFEISSISFGSSGAPSAQQVAKAGSTAVPAIAQFQNTGVFSFSFQVRTYSY